LIRRIRDDNREQTGEKIKKYLKALLKMGPRAYRTKIWTGPCGPFPDHPIIRCDIGGAFPESMVCIIAWPRSLFQVIAIVRRDDVEEGLLKFKHTIPFSGFL